MNSFNDFLNYIKYLDDELYNLSLNIKNLDKDNSDITLKLSNGPIFQPINKFKIIYQDNFFVYKAMNYQIYQRLIATYEFIELFDFQCFEPIETVFIGKIFYIIKQKKLERKELKESDILLPIVEKEIKDKYKDISFFPYHNLTIYQYYFYLDYPNDFAMLMDFLKTLQIRDAIEFSNCGFDKETNKIKIFDIELSRGYDLKQIENLVNRYSFDKFKIPLIALFLKQGGN